MPVLSRSRSGGAGVSAPSTLARCSIRLSVPPSEVARFHSLTLAAVAMAALSPPNAPAFVRSDSMPSKPPCICLAAIAWSGASGKPG